MLYEYIFKICSVLFVREAETAPVRRVTSQIPAMFKAERGAGARTRNPILVSQ